MLVLVEILVALIMALGSRVVLLQTVAAILLEAVYLLPVILIFAWRHIPWRSLGFGMFRWDTLGIGCGLVVVSYGVIALYGLILFRFGIETQGQQIIKIFEAIESPVWLFITGVIIAPFVEEIFFRGFLFQGFRQRYGWIGGMLLSSAIFAIAHLDPAALVPTFILGSVLAYVYHRSNSLWPGMTLHALVNAFGLSAAYLAAHYHLIPL